MNTLLTPVLALPACLPVCWPLCLSLPLASDISLGVPPPSTKEGWQPRSRGAGQHTRARFSSGYSQAPAQEFPKDFSRFFKVFPQEFPKVVVQVLPGVSKILQALCLAAQANAPSISGICPDILGGLPGINQEPPQAPSKSCKVCPQEFPKIVVQEIAALDLPPHPPPTPPKKAGSLAVGAPGDTHVHDFP